MPLRDYIWGIVCIFGDHNKVVIMENKFHKVFSSLHDKFGNNLTHSLSENVEYLNEVEIKSRAIYYLGKLLNEAESSSTTQREISKIFEEIFVDLTSAVYLGCCAIDNSSRSVLRRALELGIATVYLWDRPYKYWGWNNYNEHSNDLSFKEMVDCLNEKGYIDFLNKENLSSIKKLVNVSTINNLYRELSNVIHGRIVSFESKDTDSFQYKKEDLSVLLQHTMRIQNIILDIWQKRSPQHFESLKEKIPALTRYNYGN